jgi:hypothetical protein
MIKEMSLLTAGDAKRIFMKQENTSSFRIPGNMTAMLNELLDNNMTLKDLQTEVSLC